MGVQRHNVPHFKGLISADSNPRAQERDGTFTFCHALVKKSILHLEMATVPFFLNTAVVPIYVCIPESIYEGPILMVLRC